MNAREKQVSEGWGWISASAAMMMAWGIIAALGQEPTFGLTIGSMGMGIYKVVRYRAVEDSVDR